MSFFEKYSSYFPLFFNVLFPVIGILFFNWSVGDIYLLFYVELLFLGGFTIIKMFFAINDGSILSRVGAILTFFFGYIVLLLFIAVLTGNFFNGAEEQMRSTITKTTVYILLLSYLFSFFSAFVFSGKYKRAKADLIRNETFKYMGTLFFILMLILIPFGELMKNHVISYALGISIVLTRNIVDYFIMNNQKKKFKGGK